MSLQRVGDAAALHRHRPAGPDNGSGRGVAGVFPVPLFAESGGSKRRRSSRAPLRVVSRMANAALRSLNWLADTGDFGQPPGSPSAVPETTELQEWVRARAMDTAASAYAEQESMGPDAFPATDEEALQGLLRGRGSYDVAAGAANNLATFDPLLVSLPSDVRDAPYVADILPPDDAHFLEDESRMLRPDDERSLIGVKPMVPYVDPKLRGSRRLQVKFAKQLLDIGLFRVTRSRRGKVGVLFCQKEERIPASHFGLQAY